MSRRREIGAGSGGVDCTRHHECEGDGNCIGKKRITFVVRLKMSDSPKSRLQWYWGGREGVSLTPSPAPVRDSDQGAGIRPPTSSSAQTREENDAAELVLEQLDEQWFCDNVVRWPSSRSGSPPGVIDNDVASPFRLRELGRSSTLHPDVAPGFTKSRLSTSERALNPRSQRELRRLSDGDHHVRRYLNRDHTPRRLLLEPDDHHRRSSDISTPPPTLPHPPPTSNESITTLPTLLPLSRPPSGPLVGVTEDEELENDLFAKMLANRPTKLTTINPGRASLGPLQENQTTTPESLPTRRKPQPRPKRRLKGTKSLTDLEYEELRGFKDLGFEVTSHDLTPHVVRMFPGLQRQGIPPYNSPQRPDSHPTLAPNRFPHMQHTLWPRRPDSPLLNAPLLDPSIDMKGQLKSWASEMASIVSIEC